MADVINLRRARKAKARKDAETKAAENRRIHGLGKAEKQLEAARRRMESDRLDAARLTTGNTPPDDRE